MSLNLRKRSNKLDDYVTSIDDVEVFLAEFYSLPSTYNKAIRNHDNEQSKIVMDFEIASLRTNYAWVVVKRRPGKSILKKSIGFLC